MTTEMAPAPGYVAEQLSRAGIIVIRQIEGRDNWSLVLVPVPGLNAALRAALGDAWTSRRTERGSLLVTWRRR